MWLHDQVSPDLPEIPPFEGDDVEGYLDREAFDAPTRRFVRSMALDGGAIFDLGPISETLCDQAVDETERYFKGGGNRVQDAWMTSPAVRALAGLPRTHELLAAAYGRPAFAFQTLNFRRGSQQHLHSDAMHFHCAPERFMCGVWIALEDVAADAGPLMYAPGSHRLPILTMQDLGAAESARGYDSYVETYAASFGDHLARLGLSTRQLVVRKGQAFAWAANLAHGGAPIANEAATRRSLVVHFYFDGCVYFTPMHSDLAAGKLALRLPQDLRRGLWRWPSRRGRPVAIPPITVARAVRQRLRGPLTF